MQRHLRSLFSTLPSPSPIHLPTPSDLPALDALSKRILLIRRVARVNSGGKLRSISALVIVGNGRGAGGYGLGRAPDVASAVQKATLLAEKSMTQIPRFDNRTIYSDMYHQYQAVKLHMRTAKPGTLFQSNLDRLWHRGKQKHS